MSEQEPAPAAGATAPSVLVFGMVAQSAIHVGTGSVLAAIDQPVARESHTGIPYVPASSLKGALRDLFEGPARKQANPDSVLKKKTDQLFGPENTAAAGLISLAEAKLLALPFRSRGHIFVWATCPYLMHTFRNTLRHLGDVQKGEAWEAWRSEIAALPVPAMSRGEFYCPGTAETLTVEEYRFRTKVTADEKWKERLSHWLFPAEAPDYWRSLFQLAFVILNDEDFQTLAQLHLQIEPHIKLKDQTGTVEHGPWYSESLPEQTVLYSTATVFNRPGIFQRGGAEPAPPAGKVPTPASPGGAAPASPEGTEQPSPEGATPVFQHPAEAIQFFRDTIAGCGNQGHVGGDFTLGRGWVRFVWPAAPKASTGNVS